jgi:hypothetical protein
MKERDLIVPIRTRGAVRGREEKSAAVPSIAPIQTRGAMRTRGPFLGAAPPPASKGPIDIPTLLDKLREESGIVPLSAVIYGWGGKQAVEFVEKLKPHLWQEDALALLPSKRAHPSGAPVPGAAVLLNMDRPSHRRMYENANLIADIVFLSEAEDWGTSEIGRWKHSARAVIVKENEPSTSAVLGATRELNLVGYVWNGRDLRAD